MDKLGFFFITAATGKNHIEKYAQYAIKSLLKTGVQSKDVYCVVNTNADFKLIKILVPKLENIYIVNEKINHIKWKAHHGKRKFSVFKAAGLYKCKKPTNKYMVYFDTDVLFFKNPIPLLKTKCNKTWFHHGKDLEKVSIRKSRAGRLMKKSEVNVKNYNLLSKWVSAPAAWCMIKNKAKKIPDREAVAGFYILRPEDFKLLKLTYKNCLIIVKKFRDHVDVGDQKPMNAALNILEIDWHGGNRFECPECNKYFYHYFGTKSQKTAFYNRVKELKL